MALSLKNIQKKRDINRSNRSKLKTILKSTRKIIKENINTETVKLAAVKAESILARTAQKGAINKKKQARLTSRLMKKVNKLIGG